MNQKGHVSANHRFSDQWGVAALTVCIFCRLMLLPQPLIAAPPAQEPAAVLISLEGTVEVLAAGSNHWTAATTGQQLHVGDQLRAGARSRATVRLSNLSVLRIGELTTYEIEPPRTATGKPVIDIKAGASYFFSRDKPQEIQIRTPIASGAIRGTEFNVAVADDGRTTLTLIDGEVELADAQGSVVLTNGEQAVAETGRAPIKTAVINTVNVIQWNLYYPAVLDPAELALSSDAEQALAESLAAYRRGDLLAALKAYPENRTPETPTENIYLAELLLSVGLVDQSEARLAAVGPGTDATARLADGLRELVAAVKGLDWNRTQAPELAGEWLAESYYRQSRAQLPAALEAARKAVEKSPAFAFGWARVAELEFSFGHTTKALEALNTSLSTAPRNAQALALKGFLLSAENRIDAALACFEEAIATDGALGNAWLGRGLCRIRRGQIQPGLEDLQVAAALEPNRSVLRSYLGKAYAHAGDDSRAEHELLLARKFDANDPTSWLYLALLHQQQNRVNEAIRDLEQSEALNDNRAIYRSRLLLDQDAAVRGANLAGIYQDAGMEEVSAREATRAVNADYANYSAHLFLANSYNQLRDPNQINLRYETPWLSEFLVANLLAPVGAGTLSQTVSQQEYSKLFQQDRFGVASSTEYFSRGAWVQSGSQYGNFGNFGYAVDTDYLSDDGQRPNNAQQQLTVSVKLKEQLTPGDAVYLQSVCYDASAGDLAQYYDPAQSHAGLRTKETQEPLLLAGYHHEWSPGIHTLVLAGRFQDTFDVSDPQQSVLLLAKDSAGTVIAAPTPQLPTAPLSYRSDLTIYSAELQQICQLGNHGFVAGARYQTGAFDTRTGLGASTPTLMGSTTTTSFLAFASSPIQQSFLTSMERITAYGYDQWRVFDPLLLSAGVSYDRLRFPLNYRDTPIAAGEDSEERVSPKAGFTWTPARGTDLRFAYTRSLGGVSFDQSARLEPSQVAGFIQAYRSLIPESVAGSVAGATFETFGLALDQKFKTGTYFGVEAQQLNSDVHRTIGTVDLDFPPTFVASGTRQSLDYEEKDLLVTLNQLLDEYWSLGARYELSWVRLKTTYPDIPLSVTPGASALDEARLHQLTLFALFNHPSGFFARTEASWYRQSNWGQFNTSGGDFWQLNLFAGVRFLQRRVESEVGLLNLTDRDYRLNPLNLYRDLPRGRTLVVSLRFEF